MGKFKEARALTVNGAFIHQCMITTVEAIAELCSSGASTETIMLKLLRCTEGFYATETPEKMAAFIRKYQHDPTDKQTQLGDFKGYVRMITDDYNSTKKSHAKPTDRNDQGVQLKLILKHKRTADDDASMCAMEISSTSTLKAMFNQYAESRGLSLRSLRFSFNDQPLFVSQAAKKTPEQLGMKDQDVIEVHDTSAAPDVKASDASPNGKKKAKRANPTKKKKRNGRREKKPKQPEEPIIQVEMTEEQLKIQHSKMLTKIHDELEPHLKKVRQRLNNLVIERSRPKVRDRKSKRAGPPPTNCWAQPPCAECMGGKAGKSRFVVHVGEVEHLYKTRKASASSSAGDAAVPVLDLHGRTKEEALSALDESLESWIDVAMSRSYPFVMEAVVVCGCESQTLSETVKDWIKETRNVANAPKRR
ncbi:hypothetical protein ACHAWF_001082 [Thalassiosira exigua]